MGPQGRAEAELCRWMPRCGGFLGGSPPPSRDLVCVAIIAMLRDFSVLICGPPRPPCCLIRGFQVRAHYHIREKCSAAMWFGSQSLPYYQIKSIWFERFIHSWINISDNLIFLMGITERVKLSYCPLEACQFTRRHLISFQYSSRMQVDFFFFSPPQLCEALVPFLAAADPVLSALLGWSLQA